MKNETIDKQWTKNLIGYTSRGVKFAFKLGQIGPKCDKSEAY